MIVGFVLLGLGLALLIVLGILVLCFTNPGEADRTRTAFFLEESRRIRQAQEWLRQERLRDEIRLHIRSGWWRD